MSEALRIELHSVEQGRAVVRDRLLPWFGAQLQAGRQIVVTAKEIEDDRSLKQNAFYWAYVLKTISQQAVIDGIGSDEEGWNYFFKRRLLGYRVTKRRVPGKKRPSITRELRSTRELKVKPMSDYLEQVMAIAATEFGVTFEIANWESYQGYWR